ncbi:hypothetical protein CW362_21950 [Streptomyces populi]|uniref:Uncharacterized protein n=1 Tax=Streptomyces populi TaxID=2058924 RepID=A0A2I0SLW7_9ACTN|nr:hypothetical protein [Streptomyces populi]PKT70936.1 hypothetical protein CW362_21950 [Streptomyces populi]
MPVPTHPTVRRLLGTVGFTVVAAVMAAGALAPPATAADSPAAAAASADPSRSAIAAQAPAAAPRIAADFRHWGGSYPDKASAEAAGALLMLAGTAAAYTVEYIWTHGSEWVLWYW